jgi:spoIIIJ-associated protein
VEWVETTGRTIDAALDAALDQLGVHEDEVEFEVIQEPKTGFLGRRDARIRARVRPMSREKPGERRRRGVQRRPTRSGSGGGRRDDTSARARPSEPAPAAGGGTGDGTAAGPGAEPAAGTAPRRRRRSRGGRGRRPAAAGGSSNGGRRGPGVGRSGDAPSRDEEETTVVEDSVSVEEQAEEAADFTRGLVEALAVDAEVSTRREDDDVVIVDIDGSDLGLLVGPKGATLQAIEELVRTVVQRRTEGHGARIHVDVGGYRAKRRAALERFALDLAEQVRESGEDRALEPLSASDR